MNWKAKRLTNWIANRLASPIDWRCSKSNWKLPTSISGPILLTLQKRNAKQMMKKLKTHKIVLDTNTKVFHTFQRPISTANNKQINFNLLQQHRTHQVTNRTEDRNRKIQRKTENTGKIVQSAKCLRWEQTQNKKKKRKNQKQENIQRQWTEMVSLEDRRGDWGTYGQMTTGRNRT